MRQATASICEIHQRIGWILQHSATAALQVVQSLDSGSLNHHEADAHEVKMAVFGRVPLKTDLYLGSAGLQMEAIEISNERNLKHVAHYPVRYSCPAAAEHDIHLSRTVPFQDLTSGKTRRRAHILSSATICLVIAGKAARPSANYVNAISGRPTHPCWTFQLQQ